MGCQHHTAHTHARCAAYHSRPALNVTLERRAPTPHWLAALVSCQVGRRTTRGPGPPVTCALNIAHRDCIPSTAGEQTPRLARPDPSSPSPHRPQQRLQHPHHGGRVVFRALLAGLLAPGAQECEPPPAFRADSPHIVVRPLPLLADQMKPQQQLSQIEKSVTHLLVATKQLLGSS